MGINTLFYLLLDKKTEGWLFGHFHLDFSAV